ncbi:MAG: hypothetical protein A3I07_01230 [Candidatus Doudnabacteria bacterium RIFCSPLOWO2_02_FULL_42_9]|uniref:GtrA/DPMS transmembrane domain-containing protein n=1 Tax=Candidatus Doudnabacteria bacterium RIFCSPHIGHO2_01_FULL_41_86 TaxID=1817821 RepID=A0A1F5N8Q9_9BACT|nr:MAG: hypothetical protein A2717_00795 [Candidatus Doudnabacteria bacterium RIFCSPHIGHO2_01_FULL_41_86]OGE75382.1 MAG: hypothetical protein A3K07_01310 [Candidatus Doudnabacteria bacterium RIFCSPHIGHO2_01_43_10]OGE86592.1 MAG: hypothetical protein A3E28_04260 [Candidatus Doudnabacteria bacterium RIFCSPHIGHO2_12_FULL_42_22]OGE87492.1 MAG: hypothetical protein A3C49_03920 [Candidatus Doudnabacteria bacterium RIFCSPHIGHO2_02_FULL_42_25]OGE92773.1 MAG: hypothetical protein A2895_04595 [Candidatus
MLKDYKLGALAGFLTGICLIPTAWNSGYQQTGILFAVPFIIALVIMFGVWLGKFLSNFLPIMYQLSRFAAVGILNTAINFAVLNLLSLWSGITAGISVGEYNIPATIIAATNSYFWNKHWVFQGRQSAIQDVPKFILVTCLGLLARSTVLVVMTSQVSHSGIAAGAWLNISNVVATFVGIFVDFIGYKIFVFKRK